MGRTDMRKMLLWLAVALAAAGCAADPAIKTWYTLNLKSFETIKPGMNKENVRAVVGKAMLETNFPNIAEEVWDYRLLDGNYVYLCEIHFDSRSGTVKYYTQYWDPARHGSGYE